MKNPTLGYEEDTEISKREIATIQLEEAVRLFLEEKFLCALTLAGAAEEILSRLVNSIGQPSSAEGSAEAILNLKNRGAVAGLAGVSQSSLFKQWNKGRNAMKHHDPKESEIVVLNVFDEAYWMIRRGLENAKVIGVPIRNQLDFENWVVVNINM